MLSKQKNCTYNFIVFEGVCCSGKTTICEIVKEKLSKKGHKVVYNHGAMTNTNQGRGFKELIKGKGVCISSLFYFVDLIINTQNFVKPSIADPSNIVLQDRYYDAITTYIGAYGKYCGRDYDIYRISDALLKEDYLVKPSAEVFCIPPFSIIEDRMAASKATCVHEYYRQHPSFLGMVYDEIEKKANDCLDSIIIDTSSDMSIGNGIVKILAKINS